MDITNRKFGAADIIRLPMKSSPILSIIVGLQILAEGIVPTLQVLVTAKFIDTAISILKGNLEKRSIYPSLFGIIALITYVWLSDAVSKFAQVRLELSIRENFRTAITGKRARLEYRHIENSDTWDLISRVSRDPEKEIKTAFTDLMTTGYSIIRVGGILILLFTKIWWAAVLIILLSVPLFTLSVKSGKANYDTSRETAKYRRKYEYLSEVLTGREAVDERSLFGFGKQIGDIWNSQYEAARKITYRAKKKWFIKMKTGSLITTFISIIVTFTLLKPVLSGAISTGMFISLINAMFGLVQLMSWSLTYSVDALARHIEYLKDLTEFSALEEKDGALDTPAAPLAFKSLEFKDVSFKYPGTDSCILNKISFRLEAGKHYAFVGANGAGKTTVTKLLTGLYDNFEGNIYLNGVDIRSYSMNQLKSFYSVVYQDFAKYQISFRDNIQIGDINHIKDGTSKIENSIGCTGLEELIEILPHGIETSLGKLKKEGQDVSGGQWQRIAMARALVNPAPVLILDEPAAALDPISESRLYEEFEKISSDKTTIFISHRLGSTKLADEILVLGNGQVVEHGTHEYLMEIKGDYANMYESQRSWYR
ncbi:MAG: ABC transporter ATP-binding protein [Pseudomonadota bacterium]